MTPAWEPDRGPAARVAGVDVDAVATAVLACPAVVRLDDGAPVRTVATYLPGRQVPGVHADPAVVTVQVVLRWGVPVQVLAGQVRSALGGVLAGQRLDISVSDLGDPTPELPPVPVPVPPAAAGPAAELGPAGLAVGP